jgi:hypothetical protein
MSNMYQVKIVRLPLPLGPLGQGYPEPKRRPVNQLAEFSTEAEALRYALTLRNEGYGAAVVDPQGNEYIDVRERAVRIFQEARESLTTQLQSFEAGRLVGDPAQVTVIRNKIAELDQYLGSLY